MRPAVVIPAFNAADTVGDVIAGLRREIDDGVPLFVVDDGSTDDTARAAESAGARLVRHEKNRGKGAAIRTGLRAALEAGCDVALTVDADGQHPPEHAARLLDPSYDAAALVLGTRDLDNSGAPRGNLIGNHTSNFFVSVFTGRRFRDTQCGLRRYPIEKTLAVRTVDQRFGFEAEIIFALIRAGAPVVEAPVVVIYPPRSKHTTHYRAFKDTVHIVHRITVTILHPVRWPLALVTLLLVLWGVHASIVYGTRMTPPVVDVPPALAQADAADPDLMRVGRDYAHHRGKIWEVALSGSPEEIGAHQVTLLRPEMVANEGALWSQLDALVPSRVARFLVFDVARVRFRNVDRFISDRHRREIAAAAAAFAPDPYGNRIPSYQRMVYLHSLYDVSLSFEHSPLIGCTSFALTGDAAGSRHGILARTFDFEAGDIFDSNKAVFLVHETGMLGYASVAWPGLVGAVTGMNEAGLALVVHGGRAREAQGSGEPLVHTMRDVLGSARSTDDAVRMLATREPMVSHIVLLVDAAGHVAVVERAPGEPQNVRRGSTKLALTNHFEGPWANDPANVKVKAETSTLARRARADELLARLPAGASVEDAIALLRDKRGTGDVVLPAGDRRAIDARIATHGVVMDATARVIWVSEGPHLAGRFVRFDVGKLLAPDYEPRGDHEVIASSSELPDSRTESASGSP
jgi:hypothetical protein